MKTINTASGTIKLLDTPVEVLRLIRAYLPFGAARFAKPVEGAEFGLVMQCGASEAYAIKQQHADIDGADGDLWVGANEVHIASSLASYARNGFGGLLWPCAYRRQKKGGRVEAGIAYFGHASESGPETLQSADEAEAFRKPFGPGFFVMVKHFIRSMAESAARTRIPIQEVIIGLDVRKRSKLEILKFGFLVVGPHIVCIKVKIGDNSMLLDYLVTNGVNEVYHMPSIPIEISEETLSTTKASGGSQAGMRTPTD